MPEYNAIEQGKAALDSVKERGQAALDNTKERGQAALSNAKAQDQAALDKIPTPKELLQSIKLPSKEGLTGKIVSQIVPGSMTNSELLQFLAPAMISLPGLDVDNLLQLGFVTEIKDVLAKVDSKEERQKIADEYYEEYYERNKDRYKDAVAQINTLYSENKKKLELLLKRVQNGIIRIANPPVVGAASPNPTRTLQDYIDLKQQAEAELGAIVVALVSIVVIAQTINYDLPPAFDITAQSVGSVKKALELIPV